MSKAMTDDAPRTLAEYAFEQLRKDLKANRYGPAGRLHLEKLKSLYDVGAGPLREALSRLIEAKLVVQVGQKGFSVAPASLDDMRDVVETRRFLEVRALEDALKNEDDQWEGDLVAAFHRFEKASKAPVKTRAAREAWEERHTALHRALLGGCRSRWLMHSWSAVFDQAERYRRLALEIHIEPNVEIEEHARIVNAALKRDVEQCRKLLNKHIGSSADRLAAPLEKVLKQ